MPQYITTKYHIDNTEYIVSRIFSEDYSIEEIIGNLVKNEYARREKEKQKNTTFTSTGIYDIIQSE